MLTPFERLMAAIREGRLIATRYTGGGNLIGPGRATLDRWHRDVEHSRAYRGAKLRELRAAKGVGNPRAVAKRRDRAA
jgi:hypothetical protein